MCVTRQPYKHLTLPEYMPASSNLCIFVGAKSSSSASTFALGAFVEASVPTDGTTRDKPRMVRVKSVAVVLRRWAGAARAW